MENLNDDRTYDQKLGNYFPGLQMNQLNDDHVELSDEQL